MSQALTVIGKKIGGVLPELFAPDANAYSRIVFLVAYTNHCCML
jgi:hypothetical protein